MPKIVFQGKTYYSVYEMPPKVRRAYEKEQKQAGTDGKDEGIEPAIQQTSSAFEPDTRAGMRGVMWGILAALILTGIAFLLSRLIP
ncbi:MAG TPA: hypothetical protein VFQ23_18915 [Anaerolineales bacterium]|nr:hypothetical protein [Anaerolineales bacterium]